MKTSILALIAVFLFASVSFGQQFNKTKGASSFQSKTSLKEMEAWDKEHPAAGPKMKVPNKEPFIYPEFSLEGKKILYQETEKQNQGQNSQVKDPSPLPAKDFLGLNDNNNSIPPDVNGAAGPNHLMITLNTEVRIMDRDGNPISTMNTGAFWHGVPGGGDTFDPKIIYDPYENRWIFMMPSSSNAALSRLLVAVSENSDPTGNWFMYVFDADPNDNHWFDYPNFGFNKNWIVVTGNMFGGGFGYTSVFVLDKNDMYDHSPVANYTRFEVYSGFTLVPAYTYDSEQEDIYMVNNAGGNVGGKGYLNLWRVTGGYGNETVEDLGLIEIADPWNNGSYANGGNFAPQLGSDQKINTVDARMENMVYRNGKLWCVHHVYLPVNNPTRCSVQWFELALDGTILQRGRVDDAGGNRCYAFATIAVNSREDILVGYASFSPEQYASGSYSFRYADDPANTLRDSYQFIDGLAPYYKTFGADRNRWGDYTGTVVDPVDDLDFWTLQQFADLPASQDRWGTWWAYVNLDAAPKSDFTANITTVPTGSGVNFMDKSKYEPVEWLWIFEGGNPSTSTMQHPQNIIYQNSGLFDVTLIATNYLGSDTLVMEDYINSNTIILPEIAFSADKIMPCTTDTVSFSDGTIYNPLSWKWNFYPDVVTFVNGTNANSQHPQVVFNLPTPYDVTLTANNLNGASTLVKTEMIYPGGLYLPFEDDFESLFFNSKSWAIDNPDGGKTWEVVTVAGNEPGTNAAYVNIKNYNGLHERDRLISPLINLKDYNEAKLEFQYAYAQRFAQYTDSLIIYLADGCGQQLHRLLALGEDSLHQFATVSPTMLNFIPQSLNDWCGGAANPPCISIDLTPWAGIPDIRVVFETYNGFGNNIFIDNVVIDGTLSGIGGVEPGNDAVTLFPNPSGGSFTLKLNDITGPITIKISDLAGHLIYQTSFTGDGTTNKSIDLTNKGRGIYLVEIQDRTNVWVKKAVVK
jgi:PKD repeat protein